MRLSYSFVPQGTTAPRELPPATLWADVGNGGDAMVLDHHQGAPEACAASMVVSHAGAVLARFAGLAEITIVTHRTPDLDAVASCWLASRLVAHGHLPAGAAEIAAEVARHDQGLADRDRDPATDLGLVMAVILDEAADDRARLQSGFAVLDRVSRRLDTGDTIEGAVAVAAGETVRTLLDAAAHRYAHDRAHARTGRLVLGRHTVEAAHFIDPSSPLLKYFFRRDTPGAVLAVSWTLGPDEWRHIVSVEAEGGLALHGLGAALEAAERGAEAGRPLRPGREHLPMGQGRFGGDVPSPWYDGRGHAFTIVDSPSVGTADAARCASLLSPDQVWAVITNLYSAGRETS